MGLMMTKSLVVFGSLIVAGSLVAIWFVFGGFGSRLHGKFLCLLPQTIAETYIEAMLRGDILPRSNGTNVEWLIQGLSKLDVQGGKLKFDRALLTPYALEMPVKNFNVPFFMEPGPRVVMEILLFSSEESFSVLKFEDEQWSRHCRFVSEHMILLEFVENHEKFLSKVC